MSHMKHAAVGGATETASAEYDLLEVADAMRCLSQLVAEHPGRPLEQLVGVAVARIPGARWQV